MATTGAPAETTPYRDNAGRPHGPDWRLAVVASVIPGLGQLYNRQPRKAITFFSATIIPVTLAVWYFIWITNRGPAVFDRSGPLFLFVALISVCVVLAAVILCLYLWASAVVDARGSALELHKGAVADASRWRMFHL